MRRRELGSQGVSPLKDPRLRFVSRILILFAQNKNSAVVRRTLVRRERQHIKNVLSIKWHLF